jgi:hypothetical protein
LCITFLHVRHILHFEEGCTTFCVSHWKRKLVISWPVITVLTLWGQSLAWPLLSDPVPYVSHLCLTLSYLRILRFIDYFLALSYLVPACISYIRILVVYYFLHVRHILHIEEECITFCASRWKRKLVKSWLVITVWPWEVISCLTITFWSCFLCVSLVYLSYCQLYFIIMI